MDSRIFEETFRPLEQSINSIKQLMNIRVPTDDESQIIDKVFNNKFTYKIPDGDRILAERLFSVPCWSDECLQSLKRALNEAKSELDNIRIDHWQRHTKRTHLSTEIMRLIRSEFKPVMSTQAWFKFHEILGHYPELITKDGGGFNSVHLCEAPGAFVASLQHFLHSRDWHQRWRWLASTLSPYYEGNDLGVMIDEDIFIRGTWTNWCFGVDGTGNVMDRENFEQLKRTCSERGLDRVHLVTCDGSVDCANDPAEQETIVSQLIFCEVICGVGLLSTAGSLVVKMFTLFEHSSICLMYLLCCLFKQVNVFKPVTSKPGNSEVYVVASGFDGINPHLLSQLVDYVGYETPSAAMFSQQEIPSSFLEQHLNCCQRFCNFQMEVIATNLELYRAIPVDYLLDLKLQFARHFVCRFKVQQVDGVTYRPAEPMSIEIERRNESRTKSRNRPGTKSRHSGTLASRRQLILRTTEELVMSKRFFGISNRPIVSQCAGKCILPDDEVLCLKPQIGKKFDVLRSSKFCERSYLEQYLQLLSCAQNQMVVGDDVSELLLFCLNHLKELSSAAQTTVFVVVVEHDHALIKNLNDTHNFCFKVFPSLYDPDDLNSSNIFFCGHLMTASEKKDEMQQIVDCRQDISDVIGILKKVRIGCHCLIAAGPLLTRLRAGILCIMYSCFEKVFVYSSVLSPTVYLAGWNFLGCSSILENYLCKALDLASTSLQKNYTLLELIPISFLYDNDFYKFIVETNNNFIRMRFDHLLQKLKEHFRAATNEPSAFDRVS